MSSRPFGTVVHGVKGCVNRMRATVKPASWTRPPAGRPPRPGSTWPARVSPLEVLSKRTWETPYRRSSRNTCTESPYNQTGTHRAHSGRPATAGPLGHRPLAQRRQDPRQRGSAAKSANVVIALSQWSVITLTNLGHSSAVSVRSTLSKDSWR